MSGFKGYPPSVQILTPVPDIFVAVNSDKGEIRDNINNKDLIVDEMGDVLWYLTRLCDVYNVKLSELMVINMDKLFQRMTPEEAEKHALNLCSIAVRVKDYKIYEFTKE